MKTIVQVVNALNDGGAENLIKDYALFFKEKGYNVIILTIFNLDNTAVYKILKDNNIRIISVFNRYTFFNKVLNKIYKNYIPKKIERIIKKIKPNVLHFHMWVLRYFKNIDNCLKDVKLFYTCHSLPQRYFGNGFELEYQNAKHMIDTLDLRIIALHKKMADEINEMFNINNCIVLNNGINLSRFINIKESKKSIRQTLGISNDTYVIGHVGRFSIEKNHKFIVDIFNEILKKKKNSVLLFVGHGPLLEEIKDYINKNNLTSNVIILSHRDDVPRLLKSMDSFIFPSKYEGFPLSIVEAQAVGLRTVGSDVITDDVFINENCVKLSLNESPEIWANTILDDRIKNNKIKNINDYDINSIITKLERLYFNDGVNANGSK